MPYNRDSIYKYRDSHPEKWAEQQRKNQKAYYERNKEAMRAKKLAYYHKKKAEALDAELSEEIFII